MARLRAPGEAHVDSRLGLGRVRPHHGLSRPVQEPHPAREAAHPERLLQHHQPEDALRRRGRQHRLSPASARRRSADPRDGRPRFRAVCGVARPPADPPERDQGAGRHPHAAGLRHHGSRRQPDLGLLRGRDRARPRGARGGRARAARARDRLLERPAGDGRARAGAQGARRAHLDRSQPRAPDPLRRGALRDDPRRGRLCRQRLRMGAHAGAHRTRRAGDPGGLRSRDRHQGRAGLDDPRSRARDRDPPRARRQDRRPHRLRRRLPGRVCCTRAPSAAPGRSPAVSGACSAPTRSKSREPRTRASSCPTCAPASSASSARGSV